MSQDLNQMSAKRAELAKQLEELEANIALEEEALLEARIEELHAKAQEAIIAKDGKLARQLLDEAEALTEPEAPPAPAPGTPVKGPSAAEIRAACKTLPKGDYTTAKVISAMGFVSGKNGLPAKWHGRATIREVMSTLHETVQVGDKQQGYVWRVN